MSIRPILTWPDARLTQPCAEVGEVTAQVQILAADMLETMYAAPGRGLAGPQIGEMLRIFVMDTAWKDGAPDPLVCIDPQIDVLDDTPVENDEGCLSIPGVSARVARPASVRLHYTGLDGARHSRDLTGFDAVCAQHEYDHLDGVLTFDRLDADARAALLADYDAAAT
ncbi:peptide deformylase [Pseudosulfitobacter pseudonitzschiae]|uniref:Peptide deformylase n=1 Tax=Pseudosulfitobacter pseudonitzschiae TaxID=1402135 RepID=A0A073JBJ2_9RHOB|nr:peptide deformylase [Pseudosulfitobacter pseudonitzschiae]KEJ95097.1 N-formylmethionyl-tRNA deformylase [Pseudosulfitobacter pseudonitzschiae]QKS07615.1 peptide deformylase [Pseudosulfitobacter pseudonitzschiae]SHF19828.1 peptide deformylase [Pseudosulfitobacter pseudonitzschiae]